MYDALRSKMWVVKGVFFKNLFFVKLLCFCGRKKISRFVWLVSGLETLKSKPPDLTSFLQEERRLEKLLYNQNKPEWHDTTRVSATIGCVCVYIHPKRKRASNKMSSRVPIRWFTERSVYRRVFRTLFDNDNYMQN